MADISSLSNLQAGDPLDWEGYVDAKEASPLPKKGQYIVRSSEKPVFGATQQGFLSAQVDPIIMGPTNEGYVVRFTRVSAKPFKRGAVTVSQAGDYLRAAGSNARPRSAQEQADAIEAAAGATLKIDGDWEAFDKETGFRVKGMDKFPLNGNGGHAEWIDVPGTEVKDDNGTIVTPTRQVRANFRVVRFVSAAS